MSTEEAVEVVEMIDNCVEAVLVSSCHRTGLFGDTGTNSETW